MSTYTSKINVTRTIPGMGICLDITGVSDNNKMYSVLIPLKSINIVEISKSDPDWTDVHCNMQTVCLPIKYQDFIQQVSQISSWR